MRSPSFDTNIINNEDELKTGYLNIPTAKGGISIACLACLHPGSRRAKGIGFKDEESIDQAIKFLKNAKREMFGKKVKP